MSGAVALSVSDAPLSAEAAWERGNRRALESCDRHWFLPIRFGGAGGPNRSRWRCVHCGGEADGKAVRWYNAGVRHGRADVECARRDEAAS